MNDTANEAPARKVGYPGLKDPRNVVLNVLRRQEVSRIHYDAATMEVAALRTIENRNVLDVSAVTDEMKAAMSDMAADFGWPKSGMTTLHMRTMNCVSSDLPAESVPKDPDHDVSAPGGEAEAVVEEAGDVEDEAGQDFGDEADEPDDMEIGDIETALWGPGS